jgi:hypothetical protein
MKKKIVSMVVFVVLGTAARAFADDKVVDKNVLNVDKTNYTFVCTGVENPSVIIKVQNILPEATSAIVTVENGNILNLKPQYTATVKSENSFFFQNSTYSLVDETNNPSGELSISYTPVMTRGGISHCGRAGCDDTIEPSPVKPVPKIYSGLLKQNENETYFTCQ